MSRLRNGAINTSMTRDDDGHRTYTATLVVEGGTRLDGPETILGTSGLPTVGGSYVLGNDSDAWAFLTPYVKISPVVPHDPSVWHLDYKWTTKPLKRCQTTTIDDPLAEPDKIGGAFTKFTKEVSRDRNGDLIKTSSHELVRGPQVEFDHNKPTVWVEQNESSLDMSVVAAMVDTVNDATLWGLPARCVKLSNFSWERKLFGVCTYYYTRRLEFEIDYNTFDRSALDEGTKVLAGDWSDAGVWVIRNINGSPANADDPTHFIRYKDVNGENTRCILDGHGLPATTPIGTAGTSGEPGTIDIEYYPESNFLLLGIPTSL